MMEPLSTTDIERIIAKSDKATPGPWFIQGGHNDYELFGDPTGSENGWTIGTRIMSLDSYKMEPSVANAEWMAAADPKRIKAALMELLHLRSLVAQMAPPHYYYCEIHSHEQEVPCPECAAQDPASFRMSEEGSDV